MIVTGLRGVGKTVLLGKFREKALAADWVVAELEIRKHDNLEFRRVIASRMRTALLELSPKARWSERFKQAGRVLSSFTLSADTSGTLQVGYDFGGVEHGKADHGDLTLDLTDLFVAVGEAAADADRGVVLFLDVIQFLDQAQLEALNSAIHMLVQRSLPVTMVGAGLPQIAELAGDAKSYAERLFEFPRIGDLGEEDAREALDGPAKIEGAYFESDALDLAMSITGRYPYFLQELGYAVWGVASGNSITRRDVEDAETLYTAKLDESFFRVRYDRCTNRQKQYLRAVAEWGAGKQKAQDVATVLNRESNQVAPIRSELIGMGLLYTPDYGYADFTVPHFENFMIRAMPDLEVIG